MSPNKEDEDEDEKVGYGKPPARTRFKPGVSGNPKGRPKGSLNVARMVMSAARDKVTVVKNGRKQSMSILEAALKQVGNKAASGDLSANKHFTNLVQMSEMKLEQQISQSPELGEADEKMMHSLIQRFNNSMESRRKHETAGRVRSRKK